VVLRPLKARAAEVAEHVGVQVRGKGDPGLLRDAREGNVAWCVDVWCYRWAVDVGDIGSVNDWRVGVSVLG
jgi:hypothetical protein